MPHSFIRVIIHYVWSTKYFRRIFSDHQCNVVKEHILENAKRKSIHIITMAVQPEHVHLLAWLERTQPVDVVARFIKGESSHWINEQKLVAGYFSWQRGFWAESVSPRYVHFLIDYIKRQKQHHRRKTYLKEYLDWLISQQVPKDEAARMIREEAAISSGGESESLD